MPEKAVEPEEEAGRYGGSTGVGAQTNTNVATGPAYATGEGAETIGIIFVILFGLLTLIGN